MLGNTLDLILNKTTDNLDVIQTEPGPYISDHWFVGALINMNHLKAETRTIKYKNLKIIRR